MHYNFLPTFRKNLSVPSSRDLEDGTDMLSADIGKKLPLLFLDSWPLNMGPIGCPETSVRNCHYSPRNSQEERSPHQYHGGRLKSRLNKFNNRKHENSFCDSSFHVDKQNDVLHMVKAIAPFLPTSHREGPGSISGYSTQDLWWAK